MLNLIHLFHSFLPPPSTSKDENLFSAIPIQGHEPHRLGKDMQGCPLILLSVKNEERVRPAPIVLEHLSVFHNAECQISQPNGNIEKGNFTVIRCIGAESILQTYFLHILSTIVASLDTHPTSQDVNRIIKILVELFRAMSRPPKKSIQGLWAEVYFIARSKKPAMLIDAWHRKPEDTHDFCLGNQRIEIKSTSYRVRQHHFSLEQLHPPDGIHVLIASMFIERTQAGQSLMELLENIRNCIIDRPDLSLHLDEIVGLTLGNSWKNALQERFDDKLAEESLAFYEASVIPSVNPELPFGVSYVHFLSDLTELQTANLSHYRRKGNLFQFGTSGVSSKRRTG